MKTLFRFIVLLLLIVGWGMAALSLHVVRTQGDKIVVIPKQKLDYTDTYVDAREWTLQDLGDHVALVERIIESGKASQFAYLVEDPNGNIAAQLDEALKNAPPTTHPIDAHHNGGKPNSNSSRTKTAKAWWDLGN